MKVLIGGSRNWVDYNHIVRKMTILLEDWVRNNPEDKRIIFIHSASTPAENMVTEYIGKVDKLLKQKGYHIDEKIVKNNKPISENIFTSSNLDIDKAIFFIRDSCKKTQSIANISSAIGIPTEIVKG
jgi:hypothetical protein